MSDTDTNDTGKDRNPGGAPVGNRNALRHGLRGGQLPKGTKHIENAINALRRQLEDLVLAVKGEINVIDAASINSATKWEKHGLLATHWLRKEAANLSPTDRLKFSAEVAKASDARDKNIRLLSLDQKAEASLQEYLKSGGSGQ